MTGQDNIIELRGVDKSFEDTRALEGIDLSISNGEFLTLLGPSGCGKTTILRILSGFETPDQGDVSIGGQRMNDVPPERRQVNTVFQNYALFPHMTVRDNVAFGLRMQSCPKGEIEGRVLEALRMVHLEQYADRRPHQLSGGMKQRIVIAIALACDPDLLICDEPTTALDVTIQAQVLDLLRNLKDKINSSIMLITHDLGVVAEMADYVVVMYAGRVVEKGTAREIFKDPRHPYTIGLMNSKPVVGKHIDKLYSIPGSVPNPVDMPNYCYFKDRCEMCVEGCEGAYPAAYHVSPTHVVSCYRCKEGGTQNE